MIAVCYMERHKYIVQLLVRLLTFPEKVPFRERVVFKSKTE